MTKSEKLIKETSEPQNEETLDPSTEKAVRVVMGRIERIYFSGPLPHPAVLEKYEKILPGAADRILAQAESQTNHRQSLEKDVIQNDIVISRRGQILGFIFVQFLTICAVALLMMDKDIKGYVSLATAIIPAVGAYFYGKKHQKNNIEKKRNNEIQPVEEE